MPECKECVMRMLEPGVAQPSGFVSAALEIELFANTKEVFFPSNE